MGKDMDISKITIDGDDDAMYALNYSIYHLNCIAPREMKGKSIAARGLSGQVYKGAVFWDTEMFMIDYYIHTEPEIAKNLLQYRIATIDGARAKAKEYGLNGAYYAWRARRAAMKAVPIITLPMYLQSVPCAHISAISSIMFRQR